ITPKTTAILPVHVYGNPCMTEEIQNIADIYGLKIIYDAAHAFGNNLNGQSILHHGDLSILSFHATKPYNTMEGGAIICHDEKTKQRIDYLKNFGFANETTVMAPGINSKMNEMQAALGLLQLKYHNDNVSKRKNIADIYYRELGKIKGIKLFEAHPDIENHSYAYFPVFIDKEQYGMSRDDLYEKLKQNGIYARRYFYPLISDFSMYKSMESANPAHLPVASKAAEEVICLPIYPDLEEEDVERIINMINEHR
ncbi:MAG: DegT/DnrJ/EryC1/StrS family aminotransferase, partial [bacterium]